MNNVQRLVDSKAMLENLVPSQENTVELMRYAVNSNADINKRDAVSYRVIMYLIQFSYIRYQETV